jgi:preprotein translocase subunit SecG
MEIFIKAFHILVSLVLIFVVLLQSGKGASMGAAFGGTSSNALFGATGSSNFMTKLTTFTAVIFIITCLTLAYMSSHMATSSLMSDVQTEAPITHAPPAAIPDDSVMPPPIEEGGVPGEFPADHPPLEPVEGAGTAQEGGTAGEAQDLP